MTIDDFLHRNHERFLEELKMLLRFPSVSAQPHHKADLLACADWVRGHFEKMGLDTKLHPTRRNPIIVARVRAARADAPTVAIYGHYDVQPPEPLELWRTLPFEPTICGNRIFARGASDNKGQFFAHVKAVESYLKTGTPLPVNVVFVIEGEEEVGSESLATFVKQHAKKLRCDTVVISDTSMFSKRQPTITYGTRGLAALEVRVTGPSRDLHSGAFGGSVANPVLVLARLLASCVNDKGRITVPDFYNDVQPLAKWEREKFAQLPFDDEAYARFLGVRALGGEKGFTTLERRWARPTFEINGISGGYQGAGTKTIVPSCATAKITCRLVPNQSPRKIKRLIARHLRNICPNTVRLTVTAGDEAAPVLIPPHSRSAQAAARAIAYAFGREPFFVREGGSIPILGLFQRHLRAEIVMAGLGLPDDNWHSPNEKFELDNFRRGTVMSARLLAELGR
jgi:acetylornithine deacetylase/succinyl-diaminopimelate desuccinylase-like protein